MTHSDPVPEMDPVAENFPVLSSRQEAFCRHFVATGNAADAARRSGYAPASARQTGHAMLQRPHIVSRVRQIRLLWRESERAEARILLARLEQAWDAAVARNSAWLMYLVIRKQEALSGLGGAGTANRGALWPVPAGRPVERGGAGDGRGNQGALRRIAVCRIAGRPRGRTGGRTGQGRSGAGGGGAGPGGRRDARSGRRNAGRARRRLVRRRTGRDSDDGPCAPSTVIPAGRSAWRNMTFADIAAHPPRAPLESPSPWGRGQGRGRRAAHRCRGQGLRQRQRTPPPNPLPQGEGGH